MTKVEVKIEEDFHAKYERERKEKADNFPTKAENFKKKLNASINVGTWTRWNNTTFEREETTDHKSLHDYIEDFCYDLLGDNHGGWEINEGQSGNIDWNSKDDVINHNYTQFIEQSYDEGF